MFKVMFNPYNDSKVLDDFYNFDSVSLLYMCPEHYPITSKDGFSTREEAEDYITKQGTENKKQYWVVEYETK